MVNPVRKIQQIHQSKISNGVKIIVNPVAGQGRTLAIWPDLAGKIKQLGIKYSSCFTQRVGHGTELAKEAVKSGFRKIFVVGGDGALNEVVNGIDLNETTIGVIPTGSGNDLAKMLGIKSISDGLNSLQCQKPKTIDLGRALGCLFVNNLGVGIDALVASYQKRFKVFKGNLGYFVSVLRVLYNYRGYEVQIMTDEHRFCEKIISISVGNGQFHGGCFKLTPEAVIDDGFLDVCVISHISKLRFLFNIPKAIKGTHQRLKETKFFKAKKILLSAKEPLFVHFDGEVLFEPVKEMNIEILPASLEVFVGKN